MDLAVAHLSAMGGGESGFVRHTGRATLDCVPSVTEKRLLRDTRVAQTCGSIEGRHSMKIQWEYELFLVKTVYLGSYSRPVKTSGL